MGIMLNLLKLKRNSKLFRNVFHLSAVDLIGFMFMLVVTKFTFSDKLHA